MPVERPDGGDMGTYNRHIVQEAENYIRIKNEKRDNSREECWKMTELDAEHLVTRVSRVVFSNILFCCI